jgi:hypothetical protein
MVGFMLDANSSDTSLFRASPYEHDQTSEPSVYVIAGTSEIVETVSVLSGSVFTFPSWPELIVPLQDPATQDAP